MVIVHSAVTNNIARIICRACFAFCRHVAVVNLQLVLQEHHTNAEWIYPGERRSWRQLPCSPVHSEKYVHIVCLHSVWRVSDDRWVHLFDGPLSKLYRTGLNLVVAAVLRDSVCVIAALHGRLLCVMLYSLCKVVRIVLTELNEDYYY